MAELIFETGLKRYKVNGGEEISFNPADMAFVKRLYTAFDDLSAEQDSISNPEEMEGHKLFELVEQKDAAMRQKIDAAFGSPVCEKVFGSMSVYALAGGLPLWCNFLLAVIDEIDATVTEEQKAARPKVEKYMAKYAKYQKK